jgi:hypothetical protein
VRYRVYFPPGYPYEERARAALEANASAATNGIVSFRIRDEPEPDGGYKLANLMHRSHTCEVCKGHWHVWAPYSIRNDEGKLTFVRVNPGKCPACSPVAAELDSKERARLLIELLSMARTAQLAALLEAHPDTIAPLVVACDAAQSSRAVAEYRSPRDIARIEELENALASTGLLV